MVIDTIADAIRLGKERSKIWKYILFYTLLFMRHYWSQVFGEFIFSIPTSTSGEWIDFGQNVLFCWAAPLIQWPRPRPNVVNICSKNVVVVIDCSEQPVVRSRNLDIEIQTFSGKYMDHTVSILIGVDPQTGKVLLVSDSYGGAKNDQQIFNLIVWDDLLQDSEFILADQGFSGDRILRIHSGPLSPMQREENSSINEVRIIVENVFSCLKNWKICADKLRYKTPTLQYLLHKHHRNCIIVCGIHNKFSVIRAQ